MPTTLVGRDVITDAVHHACHAPSVHNSQPWRWIAEDSGSIHLHLDRERLVDTDPSGRQALLSCGAVLDHCRVAMAAKGWTTNVDYYPNPNDYTHLATLGFAAMTYVTQGHRDRAKAILARRTDRLPFAPPTGWDEFETVLRHSLDNYPVFVDVVDPSARPLLAEASRLSEALRLYDSTYHAELSWWTALFNDSDGVPQSSLVSAAESDRVDIGRSFPVTHHRDRRPQVPEDESTVLLLSATEDTRRATLACGEALSAALLDATMAAMATCTLTHMTEVTAAKQIVSGLTGREYPQVLIRVGTTPTSDTPLPTPRRPITQVLQWQQPS